MGIEPYLAKEKALILDLVVPQSSLSYQLDFNGTAREDSLLGNAGRGTFIVELGQLRFMADVSL